MAEPADPSQAAAAPAQDARLGPALLAQAVWGGACLLVAVAGIFLKFEAAAIVAAALGGAAGLLAQGLRREDSERMRLIVLSAWGLFAGLAVALTGGTAGPLAAWCLAPLAVALGFDRKAYISGGVALSLMVFAIAVWAGVMSAGGTLGATTVVWLGSLAVGTVAGAVGFAAILSLQRRAVRTENADEKLARLEALLAGQPHLTAILDSAGRLASAFGTAPAGLNVDTLFEHGLIAAAHHPDRPALQTALLRAASHGSAEVGFAPRAALDRWVELSLRLGEDGRLVGVLRDATVQRSREAALDAARQEAEQLNAGKSRFLANMSHELRTPLNAVLGFSDIMRQRLFGPMPEKYGEYAQLIHESGGHLLDLISDVLDMSKIEAARYELHKEVFDAREAVSAALRLVRLQAHEAEIQLRGLLPGEPLMVEADRRALKQIVLNLLSNALKFTPSGGTVTVTLQGHGKVLEIVVADTGVGVAAEDLARLGKPFEQAGDADQRSRGTGLGLSLVRAFAQLHGGEMSIESTLGEGTAVAVRMPVVLVAENGPRGATVIPLDARR